MCHGWTQKPGTVTVELESMNVDTGAAMVNGLVQVKVEKECEVPAGSAQTCFPEVKREESENVAQVHAESEKLLVNAAVTKAKRLAAPTEVGRGNHRKIYRPGALVRFGSDRDTGNLLSYHRKKLRYLLSVLSQQRKWHYASGVLGVLLKIPFESQKAAPVTARWSDFAAAMEVLRRVDGVDSNDLRVRRMFRVLSLQQPNARTRAKVQIELALYLISVGDREAAYDELRPIVDGKHHREDPVVNLCHGLNSYYLWYEKCVEEVSRQALTGIGSRLENKEPVRIEGTGESIAPETDDQNSYPGRMKTSLRSLGDSFRLRDSQVSTAAILDWDQPQFNDSSAPGMELDDNIWQTSQRSIYEETDEQGFLQTGEEFWRSVTIPWSPELDPQLFPIQVHRDLDQTHYMVPMSDGRTRDLHTAAVKHLKQALAVAPNMLPALLPIVQLLLAVHDIKGAVDEIDKCSQVLKKHFIPPSIKVALLESLDKKDPIQLAACHRDVLTRNPLSLLSLKGLFKLHASGNLETKYLLECICLHLDVSPGPVETWKMLASCLLEVEEGMQQLKNGGADLKLDGENILEHMEAGPRHPTLLSRADLQQLWSNRHSYWLRKHFSTEVIGRELHLDGNEWLLAYKAACAAHIYSSKVEFVEHVLKTLENEGRGELHLVEHHCQRALELFGEYSR